MFDYYRSKVSHSYPLSPKLDNFDQGDCIKHPHCGALICPLEDSWKQYQNYQSKELCFLIAEAQKPTPEPWVLSVYPEELLGDIRSLLAQMKQQHPFVFKHQLTLKVETEKEGMEVSA